MPQSTMTRAAPVSIRYWEPVTVLAAPRKVRRAISAASALEHLPEHGLEDAPVAVAVDLDRGVEAGGGGEGRPRAVLALHGDGDVLPRHELPSDPGDGERLQAGEAERLRALAGLELQG